MALTYATRLSFIAFVEAERLPPGMRRALRYVPPAVLAALALPDLVFADGSLLLSPANPRLLAGLLAAIVAWRTRNLWLTIGAGMGLFFLLGQILG